MGMLKTGRAKVAGAETGFDGCQAIIEALPVALYTCDKDGRVTWFNPAAADLWGRTPRIGEDLWCGSWKIFRPDGQPLPLDACPMAVCLREARPVMGEHIVIERPDGTRRHVQPHPNPQFDERGRLSGAFNVLVDVSMVEDAAHTHRILASIVESSDDAIISKDLDGVITSWNRGAERMYGYSAKEAIGQPITLVIPSDRQDEEPAVLERIRRGEKVDHFDTVRRRKDGSLLDVSITVSPVVDGHGRIIGASKIARDISERRAVERAIKEASRRKDEFLATLAHELRNPLAPIANGLQLLRMLGADPAASGNALDAMERQLSHLSRLVDDLMEVSRITRGRITLKKEPVGMNEVAQNALEIAKPLMEARGHRLEMSFSPKALYVDGDPTRLAQVVANLLTNAAKFTAPGGLIRLTVHAEDDWAVVRVKDNGIGIPRENLAGIFAMFTQLPCDLEGAGSGLGIGLALVRQLVAMHGGEVAARSDGPGRGAEFIVRLPLLAHVPRAAAPKASVEGLGFVPRRVLVVDDNRDAAETLGILLRTLGHDVHLAHSGPDAIDRARALKPEIVLLDLGMPGMDGYEVATRLRNEPWGKSMRVVAMTGWGQDTDRARTASAGFNDHLLKPVAFASLQEVLAAPPVEATRH